MPGRQAKIINAVTLNRMLAYARKSTFPTRNRVIIMLSVKAGLRAAEIAKLEWSMALDARGRVADTMCVEDTIAKRRAGRRVPLHPELRGALKKLQAESAGEGPVVVSARGGRMRANSIVNWFVAMFANLGADGCSSHSGRRTFITTAARNVHRVGCSLRDVQLLAGHSSIETTQNYIDGDTNGQRRLVSLL
jgi:integrase/recombinase XerD